MSNKRLNRVKRQEKINLTFTMDLSALSIILKAVSIAITDISKQYRATTEGRHRKELGTLLGSLVEIHDVFSRHLALERLSAIYPLVSKDLVVEEGLNKILRRIKNARHSPTIPGNRVRRVRG